MNHSDIDFKFAVEECIPVTREGLARGTPSGKTLRVKELNVQGNRKLELPICIPQRSYGTRLRVSAG